MDEQVLYQKIDDGIGLLKISRPDSLNALNLDVFEQMAKLLTDIMSKDELKVMIITGEGTRAFSAGLDIKDTRIMQLFMKDGDHHTRYNHVKAMIKKLRKPMDLIDSMNIPVIAAINGYCIGGGMEIVLCADIRIASSHSTFSMPEVKLGFVPDLGGTQRLLKIAGLSATKYLILSAEKIDSKRALQWGIIHEVVEAEDCTGRAIELARKITSMPGAALKLSKYSINYGYENGLHAGLEMENRLGAEAVLNLMGGIK